MGWGQKLMGLDQLDAGFDGAGIKIGIMDSGCDNSHPQLGHVTNGVDLVARDGGKGWTDDTMAHGTHCAGIIGARSDTSGRDLRLRSRRRNPRAQGLPERPDQRPDRRARHRDRTPARRDEHEPGQRRSVRARPAESGAAVASGVACIVAAGNSAPGRSSFRAMLPQSITISAVGQIGQFPADSYHAMTVGPGGPGADGIFAAKFSCFGPQVRLTAPGVAIISTVPGGGYAAWDGTSMATPHVTGLAALILAHHPDLQADDARATSSRVDGPVQILRASARPVVADPLRGGFGLPSRAGGACRREGAAEPGAPSAAPPPASPANLGLRQARPRSLSPGAGSCSRRRLS